jgi:hypothetical protein
MKMVRVAGMVRLDSRIGRVKSTTMFTVLGPSARLRKKRSRMKKKRARADEMEVLVSN